MVWLKALSADAWPESGGHAYYNWCPKPAWVCNYKRQLAPGCTQRIFCNHVRLVNLIISLKNYM